MLYLVGGASRAGKSVLATRLCRDQAIAWFSIDVLRMALARTGDRKDLDPEHDDLKDGERLAPLFEALVDQLIFYGQPYLMEGVCLRPQDALAAQENYPGAVRACFLGYPDADPAGKDADVLRFAGGPNDWLSGLEPDARLQHLSWGVETSREIRAACDGAGLAFFDTGADFEGGLQQAARFLLNGD